MEEEDCPVCLEDYGSGRGLIPVVCGCGFRACQKCYRTYLMQSANPAMHCMQCKREWPRTFQYRNFPKSFVNQEHKKHRAEQLFDAERARLPETQAIARVMRRQREMQERRRELGREIRRQIDLHVRPLQQESRRLDVMLQLCLEGNYGGIVRQLATNTPGPEAAEASGATIKCPGRDCRGFLNNRTHRCPLCDLRVCGSCLEELPADAGAEGHECTPEAVASAEAIRKSTRPCPTCGTRISKVSGCDQMFCTQCNTAFSWRTGAIERGLVHNPHYHEWVMAQGDAGGGGGIDNGAGAAAQCNGRDVRDFYFVGNRLRRALAGTPLLVNASRMHREWSHLTWSVLPRLRTKAEDVDHVDLRVKYLLNEMSEDRVKQLIAKRDRLKEKSQEVVQVLELWDGVVLEQMTRFAHEACSLEGWHSLQVRCHQALEFCNTQLTRIAESYGMKTPRIGVETWRVA